MQWLLYGYIVYAVILFLAGFAYLEYQELKLRGAI